MSSIPVGRLAGLEIRIHVSWAIILAIIVVTAGSQVGLVSPGSSMPVRWGIGIAIAVLFLLSATAHDIGHAVIARRRGVPTDTVVVYFLGAAASPDLTTTRPRDEVAIALAGPIVSIAIGLGLLAIAGLAALLGDEGVALVVGRVAFVVGALDLALGFVNLVPAFPLDGGRVVRGLAWARSGDARTGLRNAARVGRFTGLLLAGIGVAGILLGDVVGIETLDGLMVALCGWFLTSTARTVERQAGLDQLLDGLSVADVMDRDVAGIPPGLTLDTFAGQVLDGSSPMALPVTRGTELLGVIGASQLRRVRQDRWATTHAEDLMILPRALLIVSPETTIRAALEGLARAGVDALPVMDGGMFAGLLTRRAVAMAIQGRADRTGISAW
jgi:Zn-dependent protease